jgi:alpha-N-arabinofuranosidase
VNCGGGDMKEAADWVEYCNGIQDTSLVRLRREHGFEKPHRVQYWGIGNEVDGPWQIGYKTPLEYARVFSEFAKVMKWVDPKIKLIAAAVSLWNEGWVERSCLLMEQASKLIDYMALHWYVINPNNDFSLYMTLSELFEKRLSAYEGLIRATRLERKIEHPIAIAVDEWGVSHWTPEQYMALPGEKSIQNAHEQVYNLEDALVVAMQLNAFIRHAYSVKMANSAQIVNVLAPIFTREDSLVLQTTFYPFELYSRTCGQKALDIWWEGETFAGGKYTGIRTLDVTATLNESRKQLIIYVVNRSLKEPMETTIQLTSARFAGTIQAFVVNGPDIKEENTFASPNVVGTSENMLTADGQSLVYTFEPHSVTALVCALSRA